MHHIVYDEEITRTLGFCWSVNSDFHHLAGRVYRQRGLNYGME